MRDAGRVYWVGWEEDGCCNEGSTSTMRLLKGNQVLEVQGVLYLDDTGESELAMVWEDNLEMMGMGEEGYSLHTVTDEEADRLYAKRL